jgi:type I restriction enzyme M protein
MGAKVIALSNDAFEQLHKKLEAGEGNTLGLTRKTRTSNKAENVFFVPPEARWSALQGSRDKSLIEQAIAF